MHSIPRLFPGASATLHRAQQVLIEESISLTQRWRSIIGELSDFDLLKNLEIETRIREQRLSYLEQLDDELSQALNVAHHRMMILRQSLKQPHGSDLVAEYEKAADDLRFMIVLAKENVEAAEEMKLEITDLQQRIQHLALLQSRT
jgi:hypothetical protein